MSKVVKKGYLDVKLSRLFGTAYKRKFVVLLNYPTRGLKAVDILEDEFSADTAETIEVSEYDKIEVQERQSKSKGKYSFQVTIREEQLIFSCDSDDERQLWIQSFTVLKQLAMCETTQPAPPPIPEYFPVVLVKNKCASDIGHSGEYFISIQNCSIILNWKTTRAIAYQWPRTTVTKFVLAPAEKKAQLILNSTCSDGSTAEFVFTTEQDSTAKEILGMWNICLLELINTNTEKLNGNSPRTDASESRSRHIQRSISVKTTNGRAAPIINRQSSTRGRLHQKNSPPTVPGNHPPLANYTLPHSNHSITPPPLPRRPEESDSDDDGGPDYARIVDRPPGPAKCPDSPSLDDQLKALAKDIKRANKDKKKRVENGLAHIQQDLASYPRKDPEDYMEPVPSAKPLHTRYDVSLFPQSSTSESDQDWTSTSASSLSQPMLPIFENHPTGELPDRGTAERGGGGAMRRSYTPGEEAGPGVPPRPWRKDSVNSITSSLPSSSSQGGLSNRSSGAQDDPDSPTTMYYSRSSTLDDAMMSPPISLKRSTILEEDSRTNTPNFNDRSKVDRNLCNMDSDPFLPPTSTTPPPLPPTSATPPPLPPRSPLKDRVAFFPPSTTSSHRCPRCNGRKVRSALGKTISLNEHPGGMCAQDKQPCNSMPDLNATDSPSHVGLRQAPPPSGDGANCSGCSQGGSCEQISSVSTVNSTSVLPPSQQEAGSTGNFQQFKSISTEPRLPLQRQDMYVMAPSTPSFPPQPQATAQGLSMARKGSIPEERFLPRQPELSQDEQKARAQFDMAKKAAQKVEADLSGMLVRKASAVDLQPAAQKTSKYTMSVIPSPLTSNPARPPAAQPTPPPRSIVSLNDNRAVVPPVMTLGRNFRQAAGNNGEGSAVFFHHMKDRPQAHMV